MSTRSRCVPTRGAGSSSQRKRAVLDVDLNVAPTDHSHSDEVGTSTPAAVLPDIRARQQRLWPPPPVTIDLDPIDDDDVIVLSSPMAYVAAKNNVRRGRSRSNVVDVELESSNREAANTRNKRHKGPANLPVVNCESYINLERNGNNSKGNGRNTSAQGRTSIAAPPPPPPEPIFSCSICMGPLTEEMSTKCGHIFCKACIKKAIAVQGKCPACRKKMTMKDTIRIFLPKIS